jgi:cytidine deaminase
MNPPQGARPEPTSAPEMPAEAELVGLFEAARWALGNSYSPYSRLRVGAALLDRAGRVHPGCNVENASYGLTVCAERVALGRAVSEGAEGFQAVVIVSSLQDPLPPCGACRQVLHELAPLLWVISEGTSGERAAWRLNELLPAAFCGPALPRRGPDPER